MDAIQSIVGVAKRDIDNTIFNRILRIELRDNNIERIDLMLNICFHQKPAISKLNMLYLLRRRRFDIIRKLHRAGVVTSDAYYQRNAVKYMLFAPFDVVEEFTRIIIPILEDSRRQTWYYAELYRNVMSNTDQRILSLLEGKFIGNFTTRLISGIVPVFRYQINESKVAMLFTLMAYQCEQSQLLILEHAMGLHYRLDQQNNRYIVFDKSQTIVAKRTILEYPRFVCEMLNQIITDMYNRTRDDDIVSDDAVDVVLLLANFLNKSQLAEIFRIIPTQMLINTQMIIWLNSQNLLIKHDHIIGTLPDFITDNYMEDHDDKEKKINTITELYSRLGFQMKPIV